MKFSLLNLFRCCFDPRQTPKCSRDKFSHLQGSYTRQEQNPYVAWKDEKENQTTAQDEELKKQIWYWGDITREDVGALLHGAADGTYLVRKSQPEGCFTLTLREGGATKRIKIYTEKDGRTGFNNGHFQFTSIVDLIGYHQKTSLKMYNTDLDVKLTIPAARNEGFRSLHQRYPLHCNEKMWYYPHYDRYDAIRALKGKPSGTFLIRKRSTKGPPYAVSLICKNEIYHCLISHMPEGYGFNRANVYLTLQHLVLHYAHNALTPHNKNLHTKLLFPLGRVM